MDKKEVVICPVCHGKPMRILGHMRHECNRCLGVGWINPAEGSSLSFSNEKFAEALKEPTPEEKPTPKIFDPAKGHRRRRF